ncbi:MULTISPECIES: glycerol kinase GlpK [Thermotoga]|uniref:Glycerol kinase 1 n=2 Tax=Thermotoga TaxID=2335 RepID=GLPK1_THEMA|nr:MULTISPECIES: glycerol kinase GlpK [Thermotoga]Q9X049.1 RecName: Full=Glycerol kinase 1; AltName: Full=ATP:glycerol 3-phosphotransferase 1; AltName: Full=Glycerokinase 1; Short=GK 1 [Thermotoga maritima MSB8]HBF10985.1 glycerol kinase [Thermotoga neapolitana]AAD36033.1 glycerol kinase [Thermotoga maritima MSB8]ACM23800.1 Glycerol kinase 1 [Thermotoga neapolitana DSM 4359]AGL49879.1 Unknown pentose kinase [Thermotoga maritima MSB8]AHD19134.1 glycerol kinase [Thermotoga maritima MSB8]
MYVLAIDQSTSGTKAIIFDEKGGIVHRVTVYHKQYYPKPGWVEHDPEEIFRNTLDACRKVIEESGIKPLEIEALAITNQRETTILWEKKSGKPVYNAVVWQCQRGASLCEEIKKRGLEGKIKEKTGLVVDPYFSASKIRWILDNVEGVKNKAKQGEIAFGTVDSWLIWKLTKGEVHATDFSNASRTLLLNIHELRWDEEVLEIFEIPPEILPELKSSDSVFGYTDLGFLPKKIPIVGVMGDSSAALFGQGGFYSGDIKVTYGTGSSTMLNIGEKPNVSDSPIVCSVGWVVKETSSYVLEGNIHSAGDTIVWLKEKLGIISDPSETEKIALSLENNGGVYLVPAFVGLGAPYWRSDVKAAILGLQRNHGKEHVVRAALESIAYQVRDIFEEMVRISSKEPTEVRADGGITRNRFLMQFQADILNIPVLVSNIEEVSARGVAFVALLHLGAFSDLEEIRQKITYREKYEPRMGDELREMYYEGWKTAIRKLLTE